MQSAKKDSPFSFREKRLVFDDNGDAGDGGKSQDGDDDGDDQDAGDDQDDKGDDKDDKKKDDNKSKDNDKKSNFKKVQESRDFWKQKAEEAEKKQKEAEEKKLEEEGKYKELWETEKQRNAELEGKINQFESEFEKIDQANESMVENALEAFNEDDRELAEELLKGKNSAEKVSLLPKLQNRFGDNKGNDQTKKPIGAGKPAGNSKIAMDNADLKTKQERLRELRQKAGDGKITPAERKEKGRLTAEVAEATKESREKALESAMSGGDNSQYQNDRIY
ncbi:MAG: hypothetical protein ACOCWW_00190 [Bacteroidota bacterium]